MSQKIYNLGKSYEKCSMGGFQNTIIKKTQNRHD